jgi:hypothetical protein
LPLIGERLHVTTETESQALEDCAALAQAFDLPLWPEDLMVDNYCEFQTEDGPDGQFCFYCMGFENAYPVSLRFWAVDWDAADEICENWLDHNFDPPASSSPMECGEAEEAVAGEKEQENE